MKLTFPIFVSFLVSSLFIQFTYAQPANDACLNAEPITVGVGSCNSILYSNVAATTLADPTTPVCWLPNSISHSVWFSFVATKADIEISTNFGGTLANTQVGIYSGTCGALTLLGCQEDINTAGALLHTDIILHGLTIGNTYYILVDGNGNMTGTFGICAQESLPVGPVLPTQDCIGSQILCNLGDINVGNGTGGIGSSQESPSCFGSPGERSSNWYSFTAATSGTLCFTINPNTDIDYDFAVYNTSASCPGIELSCNWSPTSPLTGLGCPGGQCETCLTITAGESYSILVDRFTAASNAGFTLNFAGTTATFASPNPTYTATTACIGSATQFTNTTNGNYTYSWNFGDGFTSNLEDPTHTYATDGSYSVTLLVTAVPGGCQNSVTQTVTVNPLPTVNAGSDSSVCVGACNALSGSTNAVGSIGPISFNNNTSYPIADNDPTGVFSPITVSGIIPFTINNTSIVSVCIDITHTFDGDLDIFLLSPNGTQIQLSTDNGGGNNDYTNSCFSNTATTAITAGTAPFNGTFTPEQAFSLFNGDNTNGLWQLFVRDDAGGDIGNVNSWSITFNSNMPAFSWSPTTAMTNANTLTPTVCPTVPTTYTLTANNGIGCTTTSTVNVTINAGPTATISYTTNNFCATSGTQSVTLTGTGAYTSGVYSSTTGLSINTATGDINPSTSTPGPYTVTYTIPASGGCPAIPVTTTITISAPPIAGTLSGNQAMCVGLTTTFSSTAIGGTWASSDNTIATINAASGLITGISAGTATMTYTVLGNGGCANATDIRTVTITAPPIVGTLSGNQTICVGLNSTFSSTILGGTWTSSDNTIANINAASGLITGISAGSATMTYTVLGNGGCANVTDVRTVTITAPPIAGTLSGNQAICVGLTTTFSSTAIGGTWASSDNTIATINSASGLITGISAGTATMTYTVLGNGGCANATDVRTVTISTAPIAGILSGNQAICVGLNSTFSSTALGGTWASSDNTIAAINAASGLITGISAGSATMTYTVLGNGGCANVTDVRIVTVTAPPIAGTLSGNQAICVGLTTTFSSTAIGGTWASSDNTIATINSASGLITGISSGTATMNYTVLGSGGCANATDVRTVTVTTPPIVGTLSGNQTICVGLNSTFSSTVIGGTWASSDNTIATINAASGLITGISAGSATMTYTVLGNGGCANVTDVRTVTVTAPPIAGTLSGNQAICVGLNSTFSSTAIDGTWASSDNAVATINSASGLITGVSAGTATMTYTVLGSGGCANATDIRTVTVSPFLSPTINCGVSTTTAVQFNWVAVTGATGYNVSYQINANPIINIGAIGNLLTYSVASLTPGDSVTITLTPTGLAGTCFAANTATCIANNCSPPTPSISYPGTPFCTTIATSQAVTLAGTGTVSGGVYSSTTGLSINTVTGDINPSTSTPGPYIVTYTITGTLGCSNVIATTPVTITAAPIVGTLSGNQAICVGLTTTFSSTVIGGTWASSDNTIATINSASGLVTGVSAGSATMTYTVLGTGGCANVTATRTVTVTAAPIVGILSGNQAICVGLTTTFSSTAIGGTWASSDNTIATINAASGLITGISAGSATMTYTVLGNGGCANVTDVRTVTVTAPPIAGTLSGNQAICVGLNSTFSSTAIDGTWASSDNAVATINSASGLITGVSAGTVTMTYTVLGTGGCANATDVRTVTVTTPPIVGTLSGNQTICVGLTTTFSSTTMGGTWTSSDNTVATINSVSGLVSGVGAGTATMTYTVLGTGGCANVTATRTVTVTAAPIVGILSGNQAICIGLTATFSSTAIGGTWASSDITIATINSASGLITGVSAGTATMTYTVLGTGGCANVTATRNVTVTAPPIAGNLSGNQAICVGLNSTFSSTAIDGTWASSDNAVATINSASGLITGVSAGTATMTYTVLGTGGCTNVAAIRNLIVTTPPIAGILSGNQVICQDGNSVFNSNVLGGSWSSSNPSVATINAVSGVITGITAGTATMTYTILGTGGCANVNTIRTVTIEPKPHVTVVSPINTCTGEPLHIDLTADFPGTTFTWTSTQNNVIGATSGSGNAIDTILTATANNGGTVIYTIIATLGNCTGNPAYIVVNVRPKPRPILNDGFICIDLATGNAAQTHTFNTALSNANHVFEWYFNGVLINNETTNTFEAMQAGSYAVIATNTQTGCVSEAVFATVDSSVIAHNFIAETSSAFSDTPYIIVNTPAGTGPFMYQLDFGAWQSSNTFYNVFSGIHKISVKDAFGCTDLKGEILILSYPKFFTPNDDTYNDTWNIEDLNDIPNSGIYIFDRYGKFLKQISPKGKGWDGTFNGHLLPSTDYWFTVDFVDPNSLESATFKSHFSLKR